MPVLLAASITYLDDKKAILKHWSGINAPEYHTTINEDLTVLCLPGVKEKHKWIDADGVISLWWLGRKSSDSDDDHRKFHHHSERLKKYVNPTERSEELQTLLLCEIKSLPILKENDMPTSGVVPTLTREKPSSTSPRSHSSSESSSTHLKSTTSKNKMIGNSDKREEGEIPATLPPPPKRRRPLAIEVGSDFTRPTSTRRESPLQVRLNELEAELAVKRRRRRDCERALSAGNADSLSLFRQSSMPCWLSRSSRTSFNSDHMRSMCSYGP